MVAVETGDRARLQLEAALGAGPIASICLLPPADATYDTRVLPPLIALAQKVGAAALLVDDARLARTLSADGVHLSAGKARAGYGEAREIVGRGAIVGADAGRSRDAAMHLGEDGADYVAFGIPRSVTNWQAARERRLDLVTWWAEIFEVPCVAFDVEDPQEASALAAAGADFIAMYMAASTSAAEAAARTSAMLAALTAEAA